MDSYNNLLAKILAEKFNLNYLDFYKHIEQLFDINIKQLLASHGYRYYYNIESKAVESIKSMVNQSIALPSSVFLKKENVDKLNINFISIGIYAHSDVIKESILMNTTIVNRDSLLYNYDSNLARLNESLSYEVDIKLDVTSLTPYMAAEKLAELMYQ